MNMVENNFEEEDGPEVAGKDAESESEQLALLSEARRFTPAWVRPSDKEMDMELMKKMGQKLVHHFLRRVDIGAATFGWT